MLRNRLHLSFLFYLLLQSLFVFGQRVDTTIILKTIEISASKDKYLTGNKIFDLDSLKLSTISSGNLSNIINNYFPIYVKENAGSLGTIRFRGTSPDHTAIMYNGININSLTLGQSNISSIPSFLFDQVKIQFGSSASLFGTDAIGGSIHLNNIPQWNRGFIINFQQEFGSFNSNFSGIKADFSNSKINFQFKTYRSKKQNNFTFLNTAVKDFEKDEFVMDTSRNSALQNYGILQALYYRVSSNIVASFKMWYDLNWYEVQPNMSANFHGGEYAEINTKHLRITSGIKYYKRSYKLTFDLGFIYDNQVYNNVEDEIIATKSIITNINYFNNNLWKGNINIGINFLHVKPEVYTYKENLKESRIDLFCSYKKPINKKLNTTINLRESLVENYNANFSPSIGLNYFFINKKHRNLNINLSIAKSYKTPTFNQRYWFPNGNPDIKSEEGISYELNTEYKSHLDDTKLKFNLTGYFMEVDNWIQWVNQDLWRPQNIKKVRNIGIEFNVNSEFETPIFKIQSGLNYSYINATEVKAYNNFSISKGKQLSYTPRHIGRAYLTFIKNSWDFQSTASFTGKRFTESYKTLEDYLLINAKLGKSFQLKNHKIHIGISVNNIFNKAYQNWEFYAMPGRNYSINIKYFIKNKENEKS